MKRQVLLNTLFLVLVLSAASAQRYTADYFQQRVDHKITVALDTSTETIDIRSEVTYHNHSADDLESIYFHLWWNAFEDRSSAFSEQRLAMGNRDFYFAPDNLLGGYDSIAFEVSGEELPVVRLQRDGKTYKDIVEVILPESLAAEESITLSIKAKVKIPASFSRPGREDGLYRMTQWYPKPACLLYTSPSPRDLSTSRMQSSA